MSSQPQKKSSFRPKFEEKNKIVTKFNFVFDEEKITFKTQIPELPTKLKSKPNAQRHKQKIDQLQSKISSLKQERKKKKSELKKGSQDFDKEIEKLSKNVDLGKKCLVVLSYDLESIAKSLQQIQQKIQKKTRYLRNLQRGPRQNKQQKKTYEEMTYQQLESEEYLLSTRVSTANLSKKEQSQINSLLSKLARMKLNAPHGEKPVDNSANIESAHEALERLKVVKESLSREEVQTKNKIEAIEEDIDEFKQQINDLEEQKKNPEDEAAAEQCKSLKEQIYKLREEVTKLEQQFETKKTEYDYEQAKVQWIEWATQVQKKKNEEWEAEREERRRQRLREKEKQKNKEKNGENKETTEGKTEEEGKPERKKFNKHQKQIDTCTFLISYCEGLVQKQKPQQKQAEKTEAGKDLQKALKSGEWSKMKDLEVVKSKKGNPDDEINTKTQKPKKKKAQKATEELAADTAPKNFNHQFFTLHAFDSVRVVPPNKAEEVEGIIKQLSEKLAYFLEHPDEYIDREPKTQRNEREKQKYTAQKYAKAKFTQREKKVVNTEDFPSLQ